MRHDQGVLQTDDELASQKARILGHWSMAMRGPWRHRGWGRGPCGSGWRREARCSPGCPRPGKHLSVPLRRWCDTVFRPRGHCGPDDRRWLRHDLVAGVVLDATLRRVFAGHGLRRARGIGHHRPLHDDPVPGRLRPGRLLSRILVLGPDSSLGPIIAANCSRRSLAPTAAPRGPSRSASILALIVGAVMIAGGIAKLGFVPRHLLANRRRSAT